MFIGFVTNQILMTTNTNTVSDVYFSSIRTERQAAHIPRVSYNKQTQSLIGEPRQIKFTHATVTRRLLLALFALFLTFMLNSL